jgi:hypothetical protein
MTDEFAAPDQAATIPHAPPTAISHVELVLDNYRVTGDIRQPGVPRRLVDLLNNSDVEFFVVRNGAIDDPFADDDEPKQLSSLEIYRESIFFAIPRGGDAPEHGDAFETVRKVPVPATIILPGFVVTGNVYFVPDIEPEDVPMLQHRHFIAVTDARVSASGGRTAVWDEPIVVVNIGQAFIFAIDQHR